MRKGAAVTIRTHKPFGPSPGIFSSTGALPESGTFLNSSVPATRPSLTGVVVSRGGCVRSSTAKTRSKYA